MSRDPTLARNWLKMLAALNVGSMTAEEVEWRLAVLAPAIADEFDDAVLTPETARLVARQHKFLPTFGEICEALEPTAKLARENRRIAIKYAGRPAPKAAPYDLPPAPAWCFDREPRLIGRREPGELDLQPPRLTVAEQIALLQADASPEQLAKAASHGKPLAPANAEQPPLGTLVPIGGARG
jgi:hypothetical protein